MSWAGSSSGRSRCEVYLGTRAVAVERGGERLLAQPVDGVDAGLAAVAAWLAGMPRGQALAVWLSGGLCRPFLLPGVAGLDRTEREQAARSLAPARSGLGTACRVELLSSSPADEATLAVAVPDALLPRIEALRAAGAGRHALASVRPWWAEALQATLQREPALAALAVHDCDALTLLAGPGRGFSVATTLSPVLDAASAEAALARLLMSSDVATGTERLVRWTVNAVQPAQRGFALSSHAQVVR